VTVTARVVVHSTDPANHGLVEMRGRPTIPAGTFVYEDADLVSGWHSHDLHQIEYALEGIAEVETADTRYLLPPHQAMCTTVTRECLHHPAPLALPTTTDPLVREIMAATRADLGASSVQIAAVVGVSERTLRRRFVAVTDMTWSQYLLASRVLQGIALLVEQDRTITEIAFAVGFDSTSAFTRAFRRFTGETPTRFRATRGAR